MPDTCPEDGEHPLGQEPEHFTVGPDVVPAGQSEQVHTVLDDVILINLPGTHESHGEHDNAPGVAAKLPSGHCVHIELPAPEKVPARQSVHEEMLLAPETFENLQVQLKLTPFGGGGASGDMVGSY